MTQAKTEEITHLSGPVSFSIHTRNFPPPHGKVLFLILGDHHFSTKGICSPEEFGSVSPEQLSALLAYAYQLYCTDIFTEISLGEGRPFPKDTPLGDFQEYWVREDETQNSVRLHKTDYRRVRFKSEPTLEYYNRLIERLHETLRDVDDFKKAYDVLQTFNGNIFSVRNYLREAITSEIMQRQFRKLTADNLTEEESAYGERIQEVINTGIEKFITLREENSNKYARSIGYRNAADLVRAFNAPYSSPFLLNPPFALDLLPTLYYIINFSLLENHFRFGKKLEESSLRWWLRFLGDELRHLNSLVMDIYTFARMNRPYFTKTLEDKCQNTPFVKLGIFYGGDFHAEHYREWFTELGFKTNFSFSRFGKFAAGYQNYRLVINKAGNPVPVAQQYSENLRCLPFAAAWRFMLQYLQISPTRLSQGEKRFLTTLAETAPRETLRGFCSYLLRVKGKRGRFIFGDFLLKISIVPDAIIMRGEEEDEENLSSEEKEPHRREGGAPFISSSRKFSFLLTLRGKIGSVEFPKLVDIPRATFVRNFRAIDAVCREFQEFYPGNSLPANGLLRCEFENMDYDKITSCEQKNHLTLSEIDLLEKGKSWADALGFLPISPEEAENKEDEEKEEKDGEEDEGKEEEEEKTGEMVQDMLGNRKKGIQELATQRKRLQEILDELPPPEIGQLEKILFEAQKQVERFYQTAREDKKRDPAVYAPEGLVEALRRIAVEEEVSIEEKKMQLRALVELYPMLLARYKTLRKVLLAALALPNCHLYFAISNFVPPFAWNEDGFSVYEYLEVLATQPKAKYYLKD